MKCKSNIPWDFKSIVLFLFLIFPLGIPAFFHPGSTPAFRIVLSTFELLFIMCFAFFYIPKETVFHLPKTGTLLITAWAVWACLAVFFSNHPIASTLRQWEWFCKILFSFCLWAYLRTNQHRLIPIHWMAITGIFLVCASFGLYWYLIPDPSQYNWVLDAPNFTNIRHFSYYLAAGIGLCTCLILSDQKKGTITGITISTMMLSILWGFLFWSGSRGSIAASGIGGLFAGIFLAKDKKLFFIISMISVLIGFMASLFYPVTDAFLGAANSLARTGNDLFSGRLFFWAEAFHDVKESLLFGLGPDSYRFTPSLLSVIVQPHNALIQGVLEWGIPGAIMFIWLLLIAIYKGFLSIAGQKQSPFYTIKAAALSLIIAYLCLGLVDGVYYHALPLTLLAYAFAVISLPDMHEDPTEPPNTSVPVSRLTIRVLTIFMVAVFCLQFAVSKIIESDTIPAPFSVKGRLVRFFPSDTLGLERWVMEWKNTDPKVALQASIRFARSSSPSDIFWRAASLIAAEQGDHALARQMAKKAIQNSFGQHRDLLIKEFKTRGIILRENE